jgi:phosphoglycerate kinase
MLLQRLAERIKNIIIVGGMANTFLKASGVDIGDSFYESEMVGTASEIMRKCNVVAPIDVVCKTSTDEVKEIVVGSPIEGSICDIGLRTNHLIDKIIKESDVVVWNGPAGIYEDKRFMRGSEEIAKSLAASDCVSVIGGGDTAAVVKDLRSKIDHISNGGGAFIAWLEGSHMPGIESLQIKNN